LLNTPGINEIEGEEREQMAHDVASRADLLLFEKHHLSCKGLNIHQILS